MNATATPPPLVELRDLTFGYGDRVILKNLSFKVPRGQVTALMGVSGGGKTTVLRLIGGQIRASHGQLLFDGDDITPMRQTELYAARRRMGMLFQFGALFTDLSVYDNVAFQMREHTGLPESMIRDLVMMKLHAVGLRGAYKLMPAELSGGMARRVALARAIALDPISLGVIANLVRELNDTLGTTSLVVTHDVQEALDVVDYVYYLSDGKMMAHGTPEEMRANKDPLVYQFVHGEAEGPVAYQYPSKDFSDDLRLGGLRAA